MIKVKHPLESCNQQQETLINACPQEQKRYHELLFNYGNAVYRYHALATEPTELDFEEWLEGLPVNISKGMREKGYEACKSTLSFTRYVNEKNDLGLKEYVIELMGEPLYNEYQAMLQENNS